LSSGKELGIHTYTTVRTVTLKVLCTLVKMEEPSKVMKENVLMKHMYLSRIKYASTCRILREVEHCEFLSSPKCCQDGKISAARRCGRASGTRVCLQRKKAYGVWWGIYAEGHPLGTLNAE